RGGGGGGPPAATAMRGSGHALHVARRVVAPLAEAVHPLPEIGERGQPGLVHAGALPPDAPRVRVEPARLGEPPVALLALAAPNQRLAEPERGLGPRGLLGEGGQVRPGAIRVESLPAPRPPPHP